MATARKFCWLLCLALIAAGAAPAFAQTLTIDGNGETRGQLLAQIVPDGSAEIVWKNPALAEETVQGHFEGSEQQVLREILAPADFAAVYADDGGDLKIVKLIVLDKETAVSGPAQTTPVVEPPRQNVQQQRLQQQRLQQLQQLRLQQQQQQRQRQRLQNGQQPGGNRLRRPLQPGVQPAQ